MFGAKCSLCNGKLDNRKICKECGLDNSKSEKYYKINRSSCDDMPLTHVHEDGWKEGKSAKKKEKSLRSTVKKTGQPKYSYQSRNTKKNTRKKSVPGIAPALLVIVSVIFGFVSNVMDSGFAEPEADYDVEALYDPYEFLGEEHPAEGDSISYSLKSGQYVVGVHIAPGNYSAEVSSDSDTVEVMDHTNSIYLYANLMSEEEIYLKDLRLFEGAVVTITSPDEIILQTENGQTGEMPTLVENFVTESYEMYSYNEAEAGVDFEPGIYDLTTDVQYSYVMLTIYDEDGSEWDFRGYDLGEHGVHGSCFRNVVIPEGAIISCEDAGVKLVPSEWVWTTDYLEYYQ